MTFYKILYYFMRFYRGEGRGSTGKSGASKRRFTERDKVSRAPQHLKWGFTGAGQKKCLQSVTGTGGEGGLHGRRGLYNGGLQSATPLPAST